MLRYQNEIYTLDSGPNGETARQDAYMVVDFRMGYELSDSISTSLNISNLFDKKYYSTVPRYNAGYYGEPRAINLNISYNF
ncbi:TonB-dependent receptor [Pseudoalteromonas sp. NEC-BIFX-2020_015]|nr:TonB-dependent receptor [Pseudoalteromonas sp. NEC-BIFX-2020_015]